MAINDKKSEEIKSPEKVIQSGEQAVHFEQGTEKQIEQKEISTEERMILAELRQEVEKMGQIDELKKEGEKKAQKIEFLGSEEKIQNLLRIAREKGLVFAIKEARSMNEPYLLDILHDTLAQEGYYQDFTK